MSSALIAALLTCASLGATDESAPKEQPQRASPEGESAEDESAFDYLPEGTLKRVTWDVTGDFHLGRVSRRMDWASFMGKLRFGGLWISTPWAWSVGAKAQVSNVEVFTFGIEGELTHVETGFWGQIGVIGDIDGRGGFTAGAGWSIIGVSTGLRAGSRVDPYWSAYFVVRIPLGLFVVLGG
ncbi:MAG: hypothetical protein QF464_01895 [Myxococcota bacterium]|nr:hypothetical protein [Myxococcota bacterium]